MENTWIGGVLAQQMFGCSQSVSPNVDWLALRREAHAQTTDLPAFHFAQQNGAPEVVLAPWRTLVKKNILHNTAVYREHVLLTDLLENAGITCCTLKGVASASCYRDPFSRMMGDVDMLIDTADFERAKVLLKQNGYVPIGNMKVSSSKHHVVFQHNGIDVELHFSPCVLPKNDKKIVAETFLNTVLEERVPYQTEFGKVYIPSPRHNGLIMLIHMYNHMLKSGVGLRHLCDWAAFVDHTPDFQSVMEKMLKQLGLWNFARLAAQAAEFLGLPPQEWAQPREEDTARALYEEFLRAGNFGRKDVHYRSATRLLPEQGMENTGAFRRALAYSVRAAKHIWPFFEKYPVFIPVGLLMYAVRAPFRLLSGQAHIGNMKEDKMEADRRATLLAKLDLWKENREYDE